MAATMRQVADLAGVSLKSVSRVVNEEPNVSPALRRSVLEAVESLGWRPNALARTLRTGRTSTIAVVVPDMRSGWATALTQALVVEADRRGLQTAIEPCGADPVRIAQVLTEQATALDGAVIVGSIHDDLAGLGLRLPVPATRIGRWGGLTVTGCAGGAGAALQGRTATDRDGGVRLDLDAAADAVRRHLRALRRTRPVVVGPAPDQPGSFTAALVRELAPARVVETTDADGRAEGCEAAARIAGAGDGYDAVACADDALALGVLAGLGRLGVRVPDRMALCGCGGLEDGRFSSPSLTTLSFPIGEIARIALDDLQHRLDPGGSRPSAPVTVAATLVRRESTLGISAADRLAAPWASWSGRRPGEG